MLLTTHQIENVRRYLLENGLHIPEVQDDILDHLCCVIEDRLRSGRSYEEAFASATALIDTREVQQIHRDTIYYLTINATIMKVKGIFITAFLSVFFFALGHAMYYVTVPFTDVELGMMLKYLLITMSLLTFCFGFLPMIFLFGYRRFVMTLQQ